MKKNAHQWIFLFGLGSILTLLIYILFRITVTFGSVMNMGPITAIAAILFFFAELFLLINGMGYFFNILYSLFKYRREKISYNHLERIPAVDILIPVYNEPKDIVFKTIVAAQYIDYEPYRIIIVDNSSEKKSSEEMRQVCEERGITYFEVSRPHYGAKAGAINKYLKRIRAPFLVIFDADYRASRDFLKLTVPQMLADEKLAYIQTPQFYGNLRENLVSKTAQMQQSIFYEHICEGKSVRNATFMCGTNLIIRTSALRDIGGFDEESITEDFSTSFRFLLKGWKGSFYNQTAAFGDGPINIREYFRQQYRWARGTIGVFFSSFRVIVFSRKLSLGQRIEFFLSGSYYFIGLVWIILLLTPILYILFGIPAYMSDPFFYFWAYIPYFIFSITLFFQALLSRHYRLMDWFKTESLTLLTTPVYAKAAIDAVFGKKATFGKTKKDADANEVPWEQLYVQILLILVSFFAICVSIYKFSFSVHQRDISLLVNLFWCTFHLMLLLYFPAHVLKRRKDARKNKRGRHSGRVVPGSALF